MNKTILTWVDTGGRERLTVLTSQAGASTTTPLLRVLSNATVTTLSDGDVRATGAVLAGSGTYADLEDSWIITAESAAGYRTQLYIPSPNQALAIADLENYDAATAEWIALEAALPAAAVPYDAASIIQIDAAAVARATPDPFVTWRGFNFTADWARRTLQWADVHGNTRLTHLVGSPDSLGADFDTLMNAFQAVSNAVVTHYWEGGMSVINDPPTTDMYNSVNDECRITMQDGYGNESVLVIPAPNRAIFMADGKTLDMSQADVLAFVGAAETELLVPISGRPVLQFVNGLLGKRMVH